MHTAEDYKRFSNEDFINEYNLDLLIKLLNNINKENIIIEETVGNGLSDIDNIRNICEDKIDYYKNILNSILEY